MKHFFPRFLFLAAFTWHSAGFAQTSKQQEKEPETAKLFSKLSENSKWKKIAAIPLDFHTWHPQGLTKIGDTFFLTAVKVICAPRRYEQPVNGFDRDTGEGEGLLFRFNADGRLLDSLRLDHGSIYHPGGIDFDGKNIWVPVCEYRPFGSSIIYKVNPSTMQATAMDTLNDAIGAVAYNRQSSTLVGMNWGSRKFYRWQLKQRRLQLEDKEGTVNPHFYVDYQDCTYAGNGQMICSGLRTYQNSTGAKIRLGGLEMVDMQSYTAAMQWPVTEYSAKGTVMSQNPFYIESVNGKLQLFFIPDDNVSVMYIYRLE
jgi:hypothetical protein